jgi:hypothetical protein
MAQHTFHLIVNDQKVAEGKSLEELAQLSSQPKGKFTFTIGEICTEANKCVRSRSDPEPREANLREEILGLHDQSSMPCPCSRRF